MSGAFNVVTIASNKGGVGKTTIAANLAVYLRALREDLPVLILGFDDQPMPERMFSLDGKPSQQTILDAIRAGSLRTAIRLGNYGVHFVSSDARVEELKQELHDPLSLRKALEETAWRGLVLIDTKSDLEVLSRNAIAASDLCIVVVADQTSLDQAEKIFELFDEWGRPAERARILLSLVDLRVKFREGQSEDILGLLLSEIRRRGHPLFETFVSRSPKIEALYTNPARRSLSILHHARESLIHRQFHHLGQDVLRLIPEMGPWVHGNGDCERDRKRIDRPPAVADSSAVASGAAAGHAGERRRMARRAYPRQLPAMRSGLPPMLCLKGRNLSPLGLGIEESFKLQTGDSIHMALGTGPGEEPLLVWARVVRTDAYGMGLTFEKAEPEFEEKLSRLVESLPS